ncbi:MAG: PaaI family thioesterase [Gemmatimonadetes bacterium]|nr:PaaI family thioesterase [Gemmatimonadota bacterium]
MRLLGAELTHVAGGEVDLTLPFRADLVQQHGFLHAGVSAAIADSACGYAALSLMPDDAAVLSVEFKVNLLAPAEGVRFVARGRVLRRGRTVTVCRGTVHAVAADGAETHVLELQGTMMTVQGRGLAD